MKPVKRPIGGRSPQRPAMGKKTAMMRPNVLPHSLKELEHPESGGWALPRLTAGMRVSATKTGTYVLETTDGQTIKLSPRRATGTDIMFAAKVTTKEGRGVAFYDERGKLVAVKGRKGTVLVTKHPFREWYDSGFSREKSPRTKK